MRGGGIDLLGTGANLRQTTLAGNHAPSDADCYEPFAGEGWTSAGHNVMGDTPGCDHNSGTGDVLNAIPSLGPLANYGGTTRAHLPNPGSKAIDRGGTCPKTDQRGCLRAAAAPCDAAVEVDAASAGSSQASIKRRGRITVKQGAHGRFVVESGIVASCPHAGTVCRGTAAIERASAPGRPAAASARRKDLGKANLRIAAGTTEAVEIPLTGQASRALRHAGSPRVTIAVTLAGPAGAPATAKRSAVLTPP